MPTAEMEDEQSVYQLGAPTGHADLWPPLCSSPPPLATLQTRVARNQGKRGTHGRRQRAPSPVTPGHRQDLGGWETPPPAGWGAAQGTRAAPTWL